MRKFVALLLLAGSAAPAMAAADPGDTIRAHANRDRGQQGRSEAHDERPANRNGGNERVHVNNNNGGNPQVQPVAHGEPNGHAQPVVHANQHDGNAGEHRGRNGVRFEGGRGEQPAIQPTGGNSSPSDTVRNWRGPKIVEPTRVITEDRVAPTLRDQRRPLPGVFRNRVPIVSNVPHEGTQPPIRLDNRSRDRDHHWDTRWRNDHRYDWQDWRRRHRSHFHLSLYFDPFGWNYRPYAIGWRLWPNYYNSSRYWISDPYDYRLPYAPPGYRWIRYYDDAILVDTFTGEVRDVIHNFFW